MRSMVLLAVLGFCEPCQDLAHPGRYYVVCHGTPPPPTGSRYDADAGRWCSDSLQDVDLPYCTNPWD